MPKWSEVTFDKCSSCSATGFTHQFADRLITEAQPIGSVETDTFSSCLAVCDRETDCVEARFDGLTCVLYDTTHDSNPGDIMIGQICHQVDQCSNSVCVGCGHSGFTELYGCDIEGRDTLFFIV